MEFDLNSSINFTNTPKIPRSRSSASKSQDGGFKVEKKLEFSHDSKNIFNKLNKEESKIQVHIRTRPLIDIEIIKSAKKIIKTNLDKKLNFADEREFDFDHVYSDTTSNVEVFDKSIKNNISRALEGYNFSIMAYGQTGSGKTYTIGTNQVKTQNDKDTNNINKGIIQQSIEYIFKSIKNKFSSNNKNNINQKINFDETNNTTISNFAESTKNNSNINNSFTNENENSKFEYIIKASFVEIYNEEIIDLLNIKTPSKHIIIRSINDVTTLSGVSLINVNEPEDCYQLLNTGITNRKTSSTNMNEKSSRSHAVFSLHFEKISISTTNLNESGSGFNHLNPNNIPINFKINFIDLAGSERIKKSGATGDRFKESVSINSGLLALSKVIMALSENNTKVHVPYRDSKLTRVLKDSLNGSSITLIIACVSPSDTNYEETLNTLNYASFAKSIKVNPLINFNLGGIGNNNNAKYEEIISRLKNENYELNKQIEEIKAYSGLGGNTATIENKESKDIEILRLKNVIKTLKRKILLKNDTTGNFNEIQSKNINNINALDTDEDMKINDLEKSSFLNISEYMNEDYNIIDIKNKANEDSETKGNNNNILNINKNEYDYISRIKENNILKRENEELRTQLNDLLRERNELKEKLVASPSYLNFENVENEINQKIQDLNNIIELNDIHKDDMQTPDKKPSSKKVTMDTEISIKDLKGMEIDENKLEEESNFLLNYDNDLIIAQLSESLVNKREIEVIENKNTKILCNPIFNNDKINNNNEFDAENFNDDNTLDVNKSIQFNPMENNNNINSNRSYKCQDTDSKINSNDLKAMIKKNNFINDNIINNTKVLPGLVKYTKFSSTVKSPNTNIFGKRSLLGTNLTNSIYNSKNKNFNNNNTNMNKSLNSSRHSADNSLNKKPSNLNYSTIKKNENIKLEYLSNSNISSNNCSREKSSNSQLKNIFSKSYNNKYNVNNALKQRTIIKQKSPLLSTMRKNSSNNNSPNITNNRSINNNNNDNSLNNSRIAEINKLRLQHNISLINEKIAKLREYQRSLKEKILDAEIQKNRILKNKNEEISYMKKNVNDKQKVLKNLQMINERNQKIIEKSENTINNLKIELRNKSMEIRNLQFNNNTVKSGNNNNNGNSSLLKSQLFTGWNKFGKDNSGNCCNTGHGKFSHSMQQRGSQCSLIKDKKFNLNSGLKEDKKVSQNDMNLTDILSPINKSNANNIFSITNKTTKPNKLIYPDISKENLFKTSSIFKSNNKNNSVIKPNESISLKYHNMNSNNIYDTKSNLDPEAYNNDDKKIVHTLKFILLDLEKLFIEKNKCQKRMKNLQNDRKEIIQLKKQNLDRYNTRLKSLLAAKNRLENILKQEDPQNYSGLNTFGNNILKNSHNLNLNSNSNNNDNNNYLNTITNTNINKDNNINLNNLNTNGNNVNSNQENPLRSSCERKNDFNTYGSNNNNNNCNNNNYLNTSPNANVNDKSFKINGVPIGIKDVNNSTTFSTSKEKNLGNNSNNYNQNIQKLTAIIYKITAVNDRIDRMNNLHESTLSEINFSEEILNKQMKNIESSINRIKKQLCESEYSTFSKSINVNDKDKENNNNKSYDSIEELRKEFENNFVNVCNEKENDIENINNNNINQNKNEVTLQLEQTECNEIVNTNNTVGNLIPGLSNPAYENNVNNISEAKNEKNLIENANNINNNKKVEKKLFDKMYEMKKRLEDKERRLRYTEIENINKEKLIQDLQRKIENNNNINKKRCDSNSNNNIRIKDEDYYCNYGNDKNITLENSDHKNNNNNFVNINNNIYNISLTPKGLYSEKKSRSTQKYKLPPTNKKK